MLSNQIDHAVEKPINLSILAGYVFRYQNKARKILKLTTPFSIESTSPNYLSYVTGLTKKNLTHSLVLQLL